MTPRLVTIPFSHFCEKARWALDRAGIAYAEEPHLPLFAWGPALWAGRNRTVPSLVVPGRPPIVDSTDILRWCDERGSASPLFPPDLPEVAQLEERFDRVLGPHARRLAYSHLLPELRKRLPDVDLVPRWQVVTARALAPGVRMLMQRLMKIDDRGVARSRSRVDEIFAEVGKRLEDGRRFLAGDRFTAADLAFAALSSPVLYPAQLARFLPMDDLPPGLSAMTAAYRATPAGALALRLYEEERGIPGAMAVGRAA